MPTVKLSVPKLAELGASYSALYLALREMTDQVNAALSLQVVKETVAVVPGGTNTTFRTKMAVGPNDLVFVDGILDPTARASGLILTPSSVPATSLVILHGGGS